MEYMEREAHTEKECLASSYQSLEMSYTEIQVEMEHGQATYQGEITQL